MTKFLLFVSIRSRVRPLLWVGPEIHRVRERVRLGVRAMVKVRFRVRVMVKVRGRSHIT